MSILRTLFALGGLLSLFGCAASGPAATNVELAIAGSADMNGGAPAKVKVYYLASASAFRTSDCYDVFNSPQCAQRADLIAVDEFQLAPGRTVTNSRSLAQAPAAIGVVAAFRDIDGAKFLGVRPLTPNASNTVRIAVSGNSVSIR